jgi:hypothetical protein
MEAIEQNMEQLLELLRQANQQMKRNNQALLEIKHAIGCAPNPQPADDECAPNPQPADDRTLERMPKVLHRPRPGHRLSAIAAMADLRTLCEMLQDGQIATEQIVERALATEQFPQTDALLSALSKEAADSITQLLAYIKSRCPV